MTLPASVDAVGDFNRDGKLDFASYRQPNASGKISIYRGNGNGTFQSPKIAAAVTPGLLSLIPVDMNHDSKTDLVEVAGGSGNGTIQILLSNGDGTFSNGQTISTTDPVSGSPGERVTLDRSGVFSYGATPIERRSNSDSANRQETSRSPVAVYLASTGADRLSLKWDHRSRKHGDK